MKRLVSKERAKKTKTREKKAGKVSKARRPLRENPLIALFLAVVLWGATVFTLGSGDILTARPNAATILPLAGRAIFLLVSLFIAGVFLQITRPRILRQNTTILLLALISLLSTVAAKGILYFAQRTTLIPLEIAQFLLPLAFAPLLATILIDSVVGIAVGTWTALALAMMTASTVDVALPENVPAALPLFLTGLIATVIAAHAARHVRTRAKVARIGLIIAFSQISCVLGMTALNWRTSNTMLVVHQAVACLAGGVISALVVLLILPLIETVFHITTDITLLELSDLGHPLLQRLAIEAPGTYHHSLVVASLAQAAADEIGANSLLARVASYFHDVGKLTKPNFFAENIQMQTNPHDDLAPSMSTLVITAHVKEGLSLGLLHKLPEPITRVIREHHGTSLLYYFHHKAKEQLEFELAQQNGSTPNGGGKVDEGAFRYPGPRPSSRESAIICLADAVEAASRSMEKPMPANIEGLISDIINARLKDGQLDSCDLSLIELARIKRSFIFTLTNMLHGRVPYPKDEDRDKQQAKPPQGEQTENKQADTTPNGTRQQPPKE